MFLGLILGVYLLLGKLIEIILKLLLYLSKLLMNELFEFKLCKNKIVVLYLLFFEYIGIFWFLKFI